MNKKILALVEEMNRPDFPLHWINDPMPLLHTVRLHIGRDYTTLELGLAAFLWAKDNKIEIENIYRLDVILRQLEDLLDDPHLWLAYAYQVRNALPEDGYLAELLHNWMEDYMGNPTYQLAGEDPDDLDEIGGMPDDIVMWNAMYPNLDWERLLAFDTTYHYRFFSTE